MIFFFFNSHVYYVTYGFIPSTRVFNLLTRVFSLPTCAFNVATRAFSLLTRGFELVIHLLLCDSNTSAIKNLLKTNQTFSLF